MTEKFLPIAIIPIDTKNFFFGAPVRTQHPRYASDSPTSYGWLPAAGCVCPASYCQPGMSGVSERDSARRWWAPPVGVRDLVPLWQFFRYRNEIHPRTFWSRLPTAGGLVHRAPFHTWTGRTWLCRFLNLKIASQEDSKTVNKPMCYYSPTRQEKEKRMWVILGETVVL